MGRGAGGGASSRAGGGGSVVAQIVREPLAIAALCVFLGLGARLYGLNVAYTSDEGYWLQRTVRFGNALQRQDFAATFRSGHPGVTVMWTGLLGIGPERAQVFAGAPSSSPATLEQTPGAERLMSLARTAVTMLTAGLFGLCVVLAGRLLGAAGLLGGALLAVDPYTIGMTRLLHVDALLTPLLLVSVLAGLVFWLRGGRWPFLALSGVAAGLALLTKAPAVTLLPFFGIVWLATARPWRISRPEGRRAWLEMLAWALLLVLVYVALWPTLWVRPVETVTTVARFAVTLGGAPHLWPTFFLGQPTTGDPGLLFYPISIGLRLGPVATVGLVLLAVVAVLRGLGRHGDGAGVGTGVGTGVRRSTIVWLLVFVVVFVDVMAIGAKKFDRYMLPAIAVLTILGGVGIAELARALRPRFGAVVVALALLGQGVWLVSTYPYPLAAYNPLAGGTAVARQTIMVGWGEGLDQAATFLNAQPGAGRLVASTQYHHVLRFMFDGRTARVPANVPIDYYVVYVNTLQRNLVPVPVRRVMASTAPVYTAYVNGVPFAWVYQGPFQISSPQDVPREGDDEDEEIAPVD